MRKLVLHIILLLSLNAVKIAAQTYNWNEFKVPDISPGHITSFIESVDGSLWFGTFGYGLVQYKNHEWRIYQRNKTGFSEYVQKRSGLPSDSINALTKLGADKIMVATARGVGEITIFDDSVETKPYAVPLALQGKNISTILVWQNRWLAIGTRTLGMNRANGLWINGNGQSGTEWKNYSKTWNSYQIGSNEIFSLHLRSTRNSFFTLPQPSRFGYPDILPEFYTQDIWIGTDQGIYSMNSRAKIMGGLNGTINDISSTNNAPFGTGYIGTSTAFYSFSERYMRTSDGSYLNTLVPKLLKQETTVLNILLCSSGNTFVATNMGVYTANSDTLELFYRIDQKIIAKSINETKDGLIWFIGKDNIQTLEIHRRRYYIDTQAPAFNDVNDIEYNSSTKAIWCATQGGISKIFNDKTTYYTTQNGLSHNSAKCLLIAKEGDIWAGTDQGISHFSKEHWNAFFSQMAESCSVNCIFQKPDSSILFGTKKGLRYYAKGKWSQVPKKYFALSSYSITAICEADEQTWVGTSNNGLFLIKSDNTFSSYQRADIGRISNIIKNKEGLIWIAADAGLYYFDNIKDSLLPVEPANRAFKSHLNSFFLAPDTALWISTTESGVWRWFDDKWTRFTTFDGLSSSNVRAVCESADHYVWVATDYGLTTLKKDHLPPQVSLLSYVPIPADDDTIGVPNPMFILSADDIGTRSENCEFSWCLYDSINNQYMYEQTQFAQDNIISPAITGSGKYSFYAWAKDTWNNISVNPVHRSFWVDLVPPTVLITSPKQGDHIRGSCAIWGSAFDNSTIDKGIKEYELFWSFADSAKKNCTGFSGPKFISLHNIGILDTLRSDSLLDGAYQLSLRALDKLGHVSEDHVNVIIDNALPGVEISSPADNSAIIGNSITFKASITDLNLAGYKLEKKSSLDTTWKIILEAKAGIKWSDYTWISNTDSGRIVFRLSAWDQAGNEQTDSVTIHLQNIISPRIVITYPINHQIVYGDSVQLAGYIIDDDLDQHTVEYCLGKILNTSTIDTTWSPWSLLPSLAVTDSKLYIWKDISDSGIVAMRIAAIDHAKNRSSKIIVFSLSNPKYNKPTALINWPPLAAFISGSMTVRGTAQGYGMINYLLQLKDAKEVVVDSVRNSGIVNNDTLWILHTGKYPDGQYTLSLQVDDRNQYVTEVQNKLVIDNTPPVVTISSPDSGETLSCFVTITATALDKHLASRKLYYADIAETDSTNFIAIPEKTPLIWDTSILTNGRYKIVLTASDKAGNHSQLAVPITLENKPIDRTAGGMKTLDECSVVIPPLSSTSDFICLEKVQKTDPRLTDSKLDSTRLYNIIFKIHAGTDSMFIKPISLSFKYARLSLSSEDVKKISIFRYGGSRWTLIGGSVNTVEKTVKTAIQQAGIYALIKSEGDVPPADSILPFSVQPRIFSPGRSFDHQASISFQLSRSESVIIKIYNEAGRLVRMLKDGEHMPVGNHLVNWDGHDQWGHLCVSGLYLVTLQTDEKLHTKTMVLFNN